MSVRSVLVRSPPEFMCTHLSVLEAHPSDVEFHRRSQLLSGAPAGYQHVLVLQCGGGWCVWERVSGIVTTHAEHAVAVERRAAREGTQAEATPTIHMPSEGGVKERAGRSTGLHACTRCCSSPSCLMEPFMAVNIVCVGGGFVWVSGVWDLKIVGGKGQFRRFAWERTSLGEATGQFFLQQLYFISKKKSFQQRVRP